jgi:hypothetical protein
LRSTPDAFPCDALMSAAASLIGTEESPQLELPEIRGAAGILLETNGVIRDRTTGLTWSQATLEVGKVNFNGAEAAAAALKLDGGGWRLPTARELLTLVDYKRHDPAIHPAFECKSDWYWTSTPAAYSPADYAWLVYFDGGGAGWFNRDNHAFVRAVRPSQ